MTKSIITWAVAALLAVPAIPLFASSRPAQHLAALRHTTHKTLVQKSAKKHRTLHHSRTAQKNLVSSRRAGRKLSASVRPTARISAAHPAIHLRATGRTSAARPAIHVRGTPPTIDGMRA